MWGEGITLTKENKVKIFLFRVRVSTNDGKITIAFMVCFLTHDATPSVSHTEKRLIFMIYFPWG